MSDVVLIVRFIAIAHLILLPVLLLINRAVRMSSWLLIGLCIGIISHLAVPIVFHGAQPTLLRYPLLLGSLLPAPIFWLLCLAVFNDRTPPRSFHFTIAVAVTLVVFALLLIENRVSPAETNSAVRILFDVLPQFPLLLFIIAALAEIMRGRRADLIGWRLRLRYALLIPVGGAILSVAIVEIALQNRVAPPGLELLKLFSIIGLTWALIAWLFPLQTDLLASPDQSPAQLADTQSSIIHTPIGALRNYYENLSDNTRAEGRTNTTGNALPGDSDEAALLEALQAALTERQVYTQEGLTVGALARQLNVRDYRLRRLINQQLGFRNFNQFLNRYRIAEACRRLSLKDNEDYPIVRLAFDLGYQSLAPFNLAFKQLCGMTPTEYRRKQKSISSENAD